MQLRECCNHPYIFQSVELGPPYRIREHLVDTLATLGGSNRPLASPADAPPPKLGSLIQDVWDNVPKTPDVGDYSALHPPNRGSLKPCPIHHGWVTPAPGGGGVTGPLDVAMLS